MNFRIKHSINNQQVARGTVTKVERINSQESDYYQIGIDVGYDRDIDVRGTVFGKFEVNSKTKILNRVLLVKPLSMLIRHLDLVRLVT